MHNSSQYIHGTTPDEQARLSLLNDLLNARSVAALHLAGGEKILDVGSGLGQLTRAMARAACTKVIGIERSQEQLAEAERQAAKDGEAAMVEFRLGDALHFPLRPEEWGTFDIAHTRFLLEHVPEPVAIVRAMLQAVRPGGRIILEDDDHDILRLWPEPSGFPEFWQAYMQSFRHLGNDPTVGRRLVSLLVEAGAQPVSNTLLFFGSCVGEAHFSGYVKNLIEVIAGARHTVIQAELLSPERFDAGIDGLHKWSQRDDAAIWYAMSWAEGRR
jgi:SAM-dependent methyltransferase